MDGKGKLVCQFCKTYSTDHRGALNLHERACELKLLRSKQSTPTTKPKPQEAGCSHSWRALNGMQSLEQKAINHGYTEVCEKCQELQ